MLSVFSRLIPRWLAPFLRQPSLTGNFAFGVLGDVYQTYISYNGEFPEAALSPPELPFQALENAVVGGEPDIGRLLRWNYQLTKLYGRDREIEDIELWAESSDPQVLIRFVLGAGGSGKTRLATEAARRLRAKGWSAGFLKRSGIQIYPKNSKGLLLLLDYPEEQPELVRSLVAAITNQTEPGYRLRILVLSRNSYDSLARSFAPVMTLIGHSAIATLGPLPLDNAKQLISDAIQNLCSLTGRNRTVDLNEVEAWLSVAEENRMTLYATASSIHYVLSDEPTFRLSSRDIIQQLVAREMRRVDGASEAAGLGRETLSRLIALATIFGGLQADAIRAFAEPALEIAECPPEKIVDRIAALPWWDEKELRLQPIEPDILGAMFAETIMRRRPDMAPSWLFAGWKFAKAESVPDRLGRIIHDVDSIMSEPSQIPLWLGAGLNTDPTRADAFRSLVTSVSLPLRLDSVAATAGEILCKKELDRAELSALLNGTAGHMERSGRAPEALQYAERSVEILTELVKTNAEQYVDGYLSALNNLASRYDSLGRALDSLKKSMQAANIFERIASDATVPLPAEFNLARTTCLTGLGLSYSKVHDYQMAHHITEKSLLILKEIPVTSVNVEYSLAMAKHNLALFKSMMKDYSGALAAMSEPLEMRRRLADQNPALFEFEFAISLFQLGDIHARGRRFDLAVIEYDRAIPIFERLASASAALHADKLVGALEHRARALIDGGNIADGNSAYQKAKDARERFLK